MRILRRFCLVVAGAATLMGQAPPQDVNGWGKLKWGMTVADVSKIYEIDRFEENDSWLQLISRPIEVGDIVMQVSFGARHGSDQISKVRLRMRFGLKDSPPTASADDFDTLKTLLIRKYGPPVDGDSKVEGTDQIRSFLWTFPSTSIVLTLTRAQNNTGRIELDYTAIDQKALDAL